MRHRPVDVFVSISRLAYNKRKWRTQRKEMNRLAEPTNSVDIHTRNKNPRKKGEPSKKRKKEKKRKEKKKREKRTYPESATTLLTPLVGSRKNAKSLEGSHISVIVLGRYPPIECVNDLVICSDFLRNEELENTHMS